MRGWVSNIQRFSTQDGPGLRTTVFLKGCPLHCPWCHNRETWKSGTSLLYYDKDCIKCGACALVCPNHVHQLSRESHSILREYCIQCGKCAAECPVGALELRGEYLSPEQVLSMLVRDRVFYEESGGGVTFSGGEPLFQFEFLQRCLQLVHQEGIHVCLDTSGWGGRAPELLSLVQLYLFDIKHTNEEKHEQLTGVELKPILDALFRLDSLGAQIRIRCPIIPEINAETKHIVEVAKIANQLSHIQGVDLVPYHSLGLAKSRALGVEMREYRKLNDSEKYELLEAFKSSSHVQVRWL